eukprot:355619-Chlamydomonas_euryale.AAC.8
MRMHFHAARVLAHAHAHNHFLCSAASHTVSTHAVLCYLSPPPSSPPSSIHIYAIIVAIAVMFVDAIIAVAASSAGRVSGVAVLQYLDDQLQAHRGCRAAQALRPFKNTDAAHQRAREIEAGQPDSGEARGQGARTEGSLAAGRSGCDRSCSDGSLTAGRPRDKGHDLNAAWQQGDPGVPGCTLMTVWQKEGKGKGSRSDASLAAGRPVKGRAPTQN